MVEKRKKILTQQKKYSKDSLNNLLLKRKRKEMPMSSKAGLMSVWESQYGEKRETEGDREAGIKKEYVKENVERGENSTENY